MLASTRLIATASLCFALAVTALVFAADQGAAPAATRPGAAKLRVGVYDSRAIAVAFAPTKTHDDEVRKLQDQLKAAQAAGDTKRADEIKALGKNMQVIAHMQAFSVAPADNILERIQDKLPAIAKSANVDVIVARLDYQAANVEIIDVTDKIVAEFQPSERTLKTVAELRKHKPITLLEAISIQD